MPAPNALYAQSGGVTATINATACGLIEAARLHRTRIGRVYAAHNGIIGALIEDLIDTTTLSPAAIRALRHTPGGAFGSCRYDLSPLPQGRAQYERLIEVFRAHHIGYFFYNGGNGSAETAHQIATILPQLAYPLVSIAVPKTIDNDIRHSDSSPGFGSAAKYVATSLREAMADLASMAHSSTQVFVMEVMGRHSGWIAAACGVAQPADADGPLLLLVPEIHFDRHRFIAAVRTRIARHGYCAVAVAEGLCLADGRRLTQTGGDGIAAHDQLGGVAPLIAAMIRHTLKVKVHWSVLDYVQRAARHLASRTDVEQAYAVGRTAVTYALRGLTDIMPVIVRTNDRPYRWRIAPAPLAGILNQEKKLPRNFLTTDGYRLTARARRYFAPLIRGEAWPPFADGLPVHASLQLRTVRRKLPARCRKLP